jgi:succinate dehydrogenase / fumarate reductase cytochrome b subunit
MIIERREAAATPKYPRGGCMGNFYRTNYFFIRRLHSLLGIIPIGAFFLVHMLLNSRAMQSPEAYQWVPDTLEQVPYIWAIEIGLILLPLAFHAILGAFIIYWGDINAQKPALGWYENWAYVLQRATGIFLFVMLIFHLLQTYLVKVDKKLHGEHFDIFGTMQQLFANPAWVWIYIAFVLIAAYHFGNGIFNFLYKWGFTSSKLSQRWAIAGGLLIALVGVVLGMSSMWGLVWSDHAAVIQDAVRMALSVGH